MKAMTAFATKYCNARRVEIERQRTRVETAGRSESPLYVHNIYTPLHPTHCNIERALKRHQISRDVDALVLVLVAASAASNRPLARRAQPSYCFIACCFTIERSSQPSTVVQYLHALVHIRQSFLLLLR